MALKWRHAKGRWNRADPRRSDRIGNLRNRDAAAPCSRSFTQPSWLRCNVRRSRGRTDLSGCVPDSWDPSAAALVETKFNRKDSDASHCCCRFMGCLYCGVFSVRFSAPLPSGLYWARDASPVVPLHPSSLVCCFNCLAYCAETFATAKDKHRSPIELRRLPGRSATSAPSRIRRGAIQPSRAKKSATPVLADPNHRNGS
jgi:hypothetical protein